MDWRCQQEVEQERECFYLGQEKRKMEMKDHLFPDD
jgi:hypothetical protein